MRLLFTIAMVCAGYLSTPVIAQQTFNASLVSVYREGMQSENIILHDTVLYRVHIGFIEALGVSDPLNPVFLDTLYYWANPPVVELMAHLLIHNGYLFAVTRQTGIRVIDISDPREMKLVASFDYPHYFRPTYAVGWKKFLYVGDVDTISVLDISDFSNVRKIAAYKIGESFTSHPWSTKMVIADEYGSVYFAAATPDFNIDRVEWSVLYVNGLIHRPGVIFPAVRSQIIHTLYKSDTMLFVGGNGHVDVFVQLPNHYWNYASELYVYGAPVAIERVGNLVYVLANSGSTLHVYDISDPYHPVQFASYYDAPAGPFDYMALVGDYIYISTVSGLLIVKIGEGTSAPPPPVPSSLALSPAYPNPVASGSAATVEFALPASGQVTLTLCNTLGQELRRIEKRLEPGTHSERISTSGLNPGVYYYTLTAEGKRDTEMLVVR